MTAQIVRMLSPEAVQAIMAKREDERVRRELSRERSLQKKSWRKQRQSDTKLAVELSKWVREKGASK